MSIATASGLSPRASSPHDLASSSSSSAAAATAAAAARVPKPDGARASRHAANMALLESKHQQLRGYIQRLKAGRAPGADPAGGLIIDGAFEELAGVQKLCRELVRALTVGVSSRQGQEDKKGEGRRICKWGSTRARRYRNCDDGSERPRWVEQTVERLEMLRISTDGGSDAQRGVDKLMADFGNLSVSDVADNEGPPSSWLETVRAWGAVLQRLVDSHKTSLAATFQYHHQDAITETVERMFVDAKFRSEAIRRMMNSTAPRAFARTHAFGSGYEERFRTYDQLKGALAEITKLLQAAEAEAEADEGSGDRDRLVKDYVIAPRGDAILEFANVDAYDSPVLRFRVSSHMLAETSPIFALVFGHHDDCGNLTIQEGYTRGLDEQLPSQPPRFVSCSDGTEVKLYSMPQQEFNREESLGILLHAIHMQNDKVPRDITFSQFVALADVCLKYCCTSPLEVFVEHRWLPSWVHKAVDDQPDGLLLISYAFGLRTLFTRLSKTAVLNIVDEEELREKPWPGLVKEKIWAVRNAKLSQVYEACKAAVEDFFQVPGRRGEDGALPATTRKAQFGMNPAGYVDAFPHPPIIKTSSFAPTPHSHDLPSYTPHFSLSSTPRCPKGSHWCDATNLGWLLLVLNELQLLWTVMHHPSTLPHAPQPKLNPTPPPSPRPRSLGQILNALRLMPSPPNPVHPVPGAGGVCDPAPVLRAAVNDVYNSVTGLTLFDVDGRRHGWALSKHKVDEPQAVLSSLLKIPLGVLGGLGEIPPSPEERRPTPGAAIGEAGGGGLVVDGEAMTPPPVSSGESSFGWGKKEEEEDDDDDDDNNNSCSRASFAPNEALCLRILTHSDNFDDLHALAMTNRNFYAAFKNNELPLMRRLVRANRRLTLHLLADISRSLPSERQGGLLLRDHNKVLVRDARQNNTHLFTNGSSSSLTGLGEGQAVDGSSETLYTTTTTITDDDASGREAGDFCSDGDCAEDGYCLMTEQEAHRILWPEQGKDQPPRTSPVDNGRATPKYSTSVPMESGVEKFLTRETAFVENKVLVVTGTKSLRDETDERRGITPLVRA